MVGRSEFEKACEKVRIDGLKTTTGMLGKVLYTHPYHPDIDDGQYDAFCLCCGSEFEIHPTYGILRYTAIMSGGCSVIFTPGDQNNARRYFEIEKRKIRERSRKRKAKRR